MRKLRRLLFRLLLLGVLIIIGIMSMKTVNFSSKQMTAIERVLPIAIPAKSIDRLVQSLALETIATTSVLDTAIFQRLDTFLQKSYPNIATTLERIPINQFSYIYKWTGSKPKLAPILLLGHTDVVPIEEASRDKWSVQPFGNPIENDTIWGRGAIDNKMTVMGIMEATELLLIEGFSPKRSIYFAFGHDEEVSGKNGAQAIVSYFKKQKIQFEYILDEGQFILNNALAGLEKPLAMVGISEKGYATLILTAQLTQGGHSSMPPKETAVGLVCKAVDRLQENPFPMKMEGVTSQFFEHIGPEMNPLFKTLFANLWLTKGIIKRQFAKDPAASALLRTTTAPTMLRGGIKDNVLPTRASAKVNFRILPGETIKSVLKRVKETVADKRILVQVDNPDFISNPMPISSTDSYGFRLLQRTIQELFPDVIIAPSLMIATTDSRHYKDLSPAIYRFQPLTLDRSDLQRIHGIDEGISIESYKKAINFYRQLLLNSGK